MTKYTTTSVKSYGLCLAFLLSVFTIPTFADNQILGDNSQCDNATLHTTTGSVTISAKWTENTIILDWQPGEGAEFTRPESNDNAYSCTYNGGITLPTAPTRNGYTFGGWRVRTLFNMKTLSNATPDETYLSYSVPTANINDGLPICQAAGIYEDCELAKYAHLGNGEWSVSFINKGTLKGESICSIQADNPTNDTNQEGARYCWCRANSFAETGNYIFQLVASPLWVLLYDIGYADACAASCATNCATITNDDPEFRNEIFGVTQ